MRNICFIVARYPNDIQPTQHVFLQRFVEEVADMGIHCTVIAPISAKQAWKNRRLPYHVMQKTKKEKQVAVYFPRYFSLGESTFLGIKQSHLAIGRFVAACKAVIERKHITVDAFYGHFICLAGISACRLGEVYHKPAFVAYGESSEWSIERFGLLDTQRELKCAAGIVAVSSHNKSVLLKNQIAPPDKIRVFVNGVNPSFLMTINQHDARAKFGFPDSVLIIAFVGQFIERKGLRELLAAIKPFPGIRLICAGSGPIQPDSSQVIYSARVVPDDMPAFLSAADMFVLPTKQEGCCNAILEAMACGLPIVSSDLPFNKDILDRDNAILVNPERVEEISQAIGCLIDDPTLRERLGKASRRKAMQFSLEQRAEDIMDWMRIRTQECLQDQES